MLLRLRPFAPAALWLFMVPVLLLAGCARRRPEAASRATAGSKTAKSEHIVLDFWNGFTGPDGKTMEKLVKQFQAENRDVTVRMQIIPWGTYYDKLTLSLAYGGAPEVFVMHAARLPEFASFDTLRPLDDLFAAKPKLAADDFAPVPWRASFYQARQLALPLDVHPLGMYYNTELFKAAGLVDKSGRAKPPQTWDEFVEAARRITKDTDRDGRPDQWGFVFTNQRSNFLTFAGQFGGGILSPDGTSCIMDSPQNVRALHRMHDLIYKYKVAPKPEGVDAWLAFRQGKVGMAFEGIYMLASLEEQKGLPFAGAPVPQLGPERAVWGGSHFLCQPKEISDVQARAAWRLMRFLSDHSLLWAAGGQVPARRDVQTSPKFAALPVQAQFARQLAAVQYEPLTPKANALFPFVDPAVEAVLLDLATPEAALKDAARRINQVLERP